MKKSTLDIIMSFLATLAIILFFLAILLTGTCLAIYLVTDKEIYSKLSGASLVIAVTLGVLGYLMDAISVNPPEEEESDERA